MKMTKYLLIVPAALLLNACSSDTNYDFEQSIIDQQAEYAATVAPSLQFDPANGVIPFPNNLLFAGSVDGTLNAPVADPAVVSDPLNSLNQMDGFSTTSPIVAGISRAVDPSTVVLGSTVRVFEVAADPATTAVGSVIAELGATDVAVTPLDTQIVISPLQPLKEKTHYMVVITNGIADDSEPAQPITPSTSFTLAKGDTELTGPLAALEPVRQLTGAMLAAADTQGIAAADVVMAWTFKTQSIRDVLQAANDQVTASRLLVSSATITTADLNPLLAGKADVYIGTLDVPYFQDATPANALSSLWRDSDGNPVNPSNPTVATAAVPVSTSTQVIPVLLTVPNSASAAPNSAQMPATGWPVTIFQHGITRNRTDAIGVAEALADVGRVVIAIDMPMHGLTDTSIGIHADNTPFQDDGERTFALDFVDNATGAPGPDGTTDASGQHFYNLQNLGNSRDNLRQAVADLMVLSASIAGAQGIALDATDITFVGHSLGAMVGTTLLSYDNSITAATLAMPGGGISQLLANSGSFGGAIDAGLTAAGAPAGSAERAQFLTATQTVVDSADPINHAASIATAGTKQLHFIEVINDNVIPNAVPGHPLSGSSPLAAMLGLPHVAGSTTGNALLKFTAGDHGSILNPDASLEATVEMQTQMAVFATSGGNNVQVNDTSVLLAP